MPKFILEEIKDFFSNYKTLQNIPVEVLNYHDTEEALEIIENCQQRYKNKENLNKVQIEKIKFFLNNNQNRNCKAICNIILSNNKTIENIKIIERQNKYHVVFNESNISDIVADKEFLNYLEKTIIKTYQNTKKEN